MSRRTPREGSRPTRPSPRYQPADSAASRASRSSGTRRRAGPHGDEERSEKQRQERLGDASLARVLQELTHALALREHAGDRREGCCLGAGRPSMTTGGSAFRAVIDPRREARRSPHGRRATPHRNASDTGRILRPARGGRGVSPLAGRARRGPRGCARRGHESRDGRALGGGLLVRVRIDEGHVPDSLSD